MGKAPNEANRTGRARNEAIGKIGKAPNDANSLARQRMDHGSSNRPSRHDRGSNNQ
jgi:hypothetical protein